MPITKSRLTELRAWMKKTKTTQKALAGLLGVGQSQISRYINGSRTLETARVIKLALLTGVPVEKLLTGGEAAQILKLLGKRMNSGEQNVHL